MPTKKLQRSEEQAAPHDIFDAVCPTKPPAPYCGGKKCLAHTIVNRINAIPHKTYAEPFVGMGGVFFRRDRRPTSEVINDWNGDVANFFRILQRHYPQFMEVLKFQLTTRREFDRLSACDPRTLTDLERAARFIYLQRTAYGGKVVDQAFGLELGRYSARFNMTKLGRALEDIHERLSGVVVECLPYREFIQRYDRADTLFYLDPPYWGSEDYYGKDLFSESDFAQLASLLGSIKGSFILSLNDVPPIRRLFRKFDVANAQVPYSLYKKGPTSAAELIISNTAPTNPAH